MGSKSELSSEERAQIRILRKVNPHWLGGRIVFKISRSPSTVNRFLQDLENYGKSKRSGRPRKITEYKRRRICALVSRQKLTARKAMNKVTGVEKRPENPMVPNVQQTTA